MSVELGKDFEVRVFAPYVFGWRNHAIAIYTGLSKAGAYRVLGRYDSTNKTCYTYLDGKMVSI